MGFMLNAFSEGLKAWLELVSSIKTWKKGSERAVNKPLLTLLLLARALRGEPSRVQFKELHEPLARLLKEFGPRRQTYHPEYPFWHLQSDGHTDADITVQTCWDADRLDLGRVGINPAPEKLCTIAARDPEIMEWAYERSVHL